MPWYAKGREHDCKPITRSECPATNRPAAGTRLGAGWNAHARRLDPCGAFRACDGQAHMAPIIFHPLFSMARAGRSEEHTSELQLLMRISYAVFCLKTTKIHTCKLILHPLYNFKRNLP